MLLWKRFTRDSLFNIRLIRAIILLCGFAVGSIISYTVFQKAFHYDVGFSRLELYTAYLIIFALALLYVVEPWIWRRLLGSDEKMLSRRFAFHAWPVILWIPAGLLWNAFDRRIALLPILLMFFNRLSYALRHREADFKWLLSEPVAKYVAMVIAVVFSMALLGEQGSEFMIIAYFLWFLSLFLFPLEPRRAIVIESFIVATPFLAVAVFGPGTGSAADNLFIFTAIVFVGGVFMVCSLRKQRARFYAPIMWAAIILAVATLEFAVRQTGYDEYLRPRQVGRNMKTDELLFYVPKDLFPGVDERRVYVMRFRFAEATVDKTPGVKRIICLGGSSTWGSGVARHETWPAFLEELIRGKGIEAEVINAGISGYTSFQILILIKEYMLRFNPDAVILYVGHNDMAHSYGPYSDRELWEMMQGQRGRYGWAITAAQKQLGQMRLYNALRIAVVGAKRARRPGAEVSASRPNEFLANLRDIYQLLEPEGIPLFLMAEAMQVEDRDYHTGMSELARRLNIPFKDVYTDFKLRPDGDKLFIDMVHLTPEGNRQVAQHAQDLLKKTGVIP